MSEDDDLDLSAVAADAALLDALAAGTPDSTDGIAEDPALAGLTALRTALDDDLLLSSRPAPLQAAPVGDVVALRRPSGRRSGGRAAVLLAGAALTLSSTGVAAATYDARPGDAFYGLRTAVAGPRAEDPDLLRERLDAVQQRLSSPDAATRDSAQEELAEVATLLSELKPELRGELEQRHATLVERLEEMRPDAPPADPPAGPPAGVPTGPPADAPAGPPAEPPGRPTDKPSQAATPDSRPEPTRGPQTAPPAQDRPSPQATRPSPRGSASPPAQRPSPRSSQGVPPSRSPRAGQPDGVGKPSLAPAEELTPRD